MSGFPGSPRTLRGALIGLDPANPLASIVVFQYNPEAMSRTLAPRSGAGQGGAGGGRSEALRLGGPPVETISITVEVDATDQLETADPLATTLGIYPQLSALEMLVYPKTLTVIANALLAVAGTIEVVPPEAPLTLLVWGLKRVLPVRLEQFTITEEAFDPGLNPIRARVQLSLRVLSYNDLPLASVGGALFLVHQVVKEVMATIGSVGNLSAIGSVAF